MRLGCYAQVGVLESDDTLSSQVAIVPTDTFPAFVCDVSDSSAVERLYYMKEMSSRWVLQRNRICRHYETTVLTMVCGTAASRSASCVEIGPTSARTHWVSQRPMVRVSATPTGWRGNCCLERYETHARCRLLLPSLPAPSFIGLMKRSTTFSRDRRSIP